MKQFKGVLILLTVIAAIGGVFWFANRFGSGEKVESEKSAVVCKTQNECFWTAHIHAEIKVYRGNEQVELNFEQGKLEEEHTHTERDKLHWHDLIPVDPDTKEVKNWSALEVGGIPKDLNLNIEGEPKFIVGGVEVNSSHIWENGDEIEIRYE